MATRTKRFRLHLTDGDGRVIDSWDTDDSYDHDVFASLIDHVRLEADRKDLDAVLSEAL